MAAPSADEMRLARKARLVAIVMVATIVAWMLAQLIGGAAGLPTRYAFLFDFAALAAFVWALAVTWQIWRARRDAAGHPALRPIGNAGQPDTAARLGGLRRHAMLSDDDRIFTNLYGMRDRSLAGASRAAPGTAPRT